MPNVILINQPVPQGNIPIIQSLFSATVHLLFQHSHAHPNLNCEVRVTYRANGPQTRCGGNCDIGYDIDLTAENDDWCKHLYQFSHEACHVFAQYQQAQHSNQWFEESLCEMSSLYCIKNIAAMGAKDQGPCVDLLAGSSPYHQSLNAYAEKLINSPDRACDSDQLQFWLQRFEMDLRRDPYIRCLNGIVANRLLDLFMATPSNWAAVEFLNVNPCANGQDSFVEYLDNWQAATPHQYQALINQVKAMFGLKA
jgi:hypothetical protein